MLRKSWTSTTFQPAIPTPTQREHPMSTTPKVKQSEPSSTPATSSGSVRVFWLDREGALQNVQKATKELIRRHPEIERVILFGSLARGDAVPGSDADLLLILRECELSFRERSVQYRPAGVDMGVDVFAYTRGELEEMLRAGNCFVGQAL